MINVYQSRRVLAREAFMCHYMNGGGGGIKSAGSSGKQSYIRPDEAGMVGASVKDLRKMPAERRALYTDQIVADRKRQPYWGKKS